MLYYKKAYALLLLSLVQLLLPILASRGDQLDKFRACVSENVAHRCTNDGLRQRSGHALPLYLRLTGWTCASDIDYGCQRAITDFLVKHGEPVEQYHGKWPFYRMLGIQEPASVLFSILNGYTHLSGLRQVRTQVTRRHPMRRYYIAFAFIGMNAWLWSTIFHIRDFNWTEKMDYFSAGTYVLYGLFYSVIQVFRLFELQHYKVVAALWAMVCLGCLLSHIGYLTFVTFDYSYNMLANVIVGSLHGLVWLIYSAINYKRKPRWSVWPAYIVLALACAMSLELLDFPPWFYLVDAHALWHLATIPITVAWYRFLMRDAMWEQTQRSGKSLRARY